MNMKRREVIGYRQWAQWAAPIAYRLSPIASFATLLLTVCTACAQTRSLSVDTNGVLLVPTNFFKANSNMLNQAVGGSGGGAFTLNGITASNQTFSAGSSGTDFAISSSGTNHAFNLPTQDGSKVRGLLETVDAHSDHPRPDAAVRNGA